MSTKARVLILILVCLEQIFWIAGSVYLVDCRGWDRCTVILGILLALGCSYTQVIKTFDGVARKRENGK